MSAPTIGIVIPAFNPTAEHLAACLASVTHQNGEWDCVIVDDGSTNEIRVDDERMHVIRQENRGVSHARNRGAAIVKGDYIAFLDQDDEWKPGKLERQIAFMRDNDLAACDTNFDIVRNNEIIATGYAEHNGNLHDLLTGASIGLSTLIVRREPFEQAGGFDTSLAQVQDWKLMLTLVRNKQRLRRLQDNLCVYNLHDANATLDFRATYRETILVLRQQAAIRNQPHISRAIRHGRRHARTLYSHQAIDAYRRGDREALVWAAKKRPLIVGKAVIRKITQPLSRSAGR